MEVSDQFVSDSGEVEGGGDLVQEAYIYLTEHRYPQDCTYARKRSIRKKAGKFVVRDGELFFKKKRKGKVIELRYIQNRDEQLKILHACHTDATAGHMGIKRTTTRISERFMWNGIVKDVKEMISRCDACQRMNKKISSTMPELYPVPVTSPWYHIGIDFVGPITPLSHNGNRFILTVSDYFTKWVEAVALPSKCAQGVAESLFKIFMRMGLPHVLTTDQGKEFRNQLNEELMRSLGIKHRLTTAYHPQANGLDERYNQTLQNMLVKYATDKRDEWDDYLDTCVYAYNTSVQESTRFSPFEVMFGRKPTMPIDIDMATNIPEDQLQKYLEAKELSQTRVEEMASQRQQLLQQVKANIKQAQDKQKEYYDREHANPAAYKVGAKVLKKDFLRKKRKGGKMDTRFVGPYVITKNVGKGLYALQLVKNPSVVIQRVNGAHLKPYQTPLQSPASSFASNSSSASHNQSHDGRLLSEEGESLANGPHNSFTSKGDNSTPATASDDSIPPLPPPMPPLSLLKGAMGPESSIPPAKKPHISPAASKHDDTYTVDCPPADLTYTKCPAQPKHLDVLPPLPCGSLPSPSAASSPEKRLPQPHNKAAQNLLFKWRQSRLRNESNEKTVVTLDDYHLTGETSEPQPPWINNGLVTLSIADKAILEGKEWLTDSIVNAAQTMLADQFNMTTGFQSTNAGLCMTFTIEPDEFVQILHDGSAHWVTISTISCMHPEVKIFDSLYCTLSPALKRQIAALLATKERKISVHFMDVQMQAGSSDCGLFAIAFATSLCYGQSPGKFHFDQSAMRKHLISCFERGHFEMFPIDRNRRSKNKVKATKTIAVYCSCRMPELLGSEMIQCADCKDWFHIGFCITVDKKARSLKWHCISCS